MPPSSDQDFWLAPEGPYRQLAESLVGFDPRIRRRDLRTISRDVPWPAASPRLVVLDIQRDGSTSPPVTFTGSPELEAHLRLSPGLGPNEKRTVYVLEGLHPEFISIIGNHFKLHPAIFVDHERITDEDSAVHAANDDMTLPSTLCTRDYCCLKYTETLELSSDHPEFKHGFDTYCAVTGRRIGTTRYAGRFVPVKMLRRKCTFWSRKAEHGSGLIICDPPLTKVRRLASDFVCDVEVSPFQGGYLDFIPRDAQLASQVENPIPGPPRTAMLDDLVYYLQHRSRVLPRALLDDAQAPAIFVRKLVACHYSRLIGFLRSSVHIVQDGLTRQADFSNFSISRAEELWSDMQSLEIRTTEYCAALKNNMLQLRIPVVDPVDPTAVHFWHDTEIDYQVLHSRYLDLMHRVESLNLASTGLAGIAGNRQAQNEMRLSLAATERSVREAKSTKALTLLGLVFFPLAFKASLFSMAEPYGPGGKRFWVVAAIGLPLMALVMVCYSVLDLGYGSGGARWSMGTFLKAARDRWFPSREFEATHA